MHQRRAIVLFILFLLSQPLLAGVVKIGVFSPSGFEAGMHRWQPTAAYLQSRLPQHIFQVLPYQNLRELEQDARRGKFEFVLTQPASFVKLEQQAGLIRLLTRQQQDKSLRHPHTAAVIFTRADNTNLKNIKDFNRIRFIAANGHDYSGWQLTRLELLHHRQDPDTAFSEVKFAGDVAGVMRGVMEGSYDAGAMSAREFDRFLRQGVITRAAVRILEQQASADFPYSYSCSLYPHWPLGAIPATPSALQNQVTQALLSIPQEHPALRAGQYAGWTAPEDYRTVRRLLDKSMAQHVSDHKLATAGLWVEQNESWLLISLALSLFLWLLIRLVRRISIPQQASNQSL